MGTFRGLITLVLLVAFLALVVWLFFFRSRQDFDAAARLPLEDDRKNKDRQNEDRGENTDE